MKLLERIQSLPAAHWRLYRIFKILVLAILTLPIPDGRAARADPCRDNITYSLFGLLTARVNAAIFISALE